MSLLSRHSIQAIADVRSRPFSARLPQFNRDLLEASLRNAGIRYVFLGDELGARRSERECYVDRVARYDRIARTSLFRTGLDRVQAGAEKFRLALMCAEKDPLECHRTILVCRELRERLNISHVLEDGSMETQRAAEARLMAEERVPSSDLFASPQELLATAYDRRGGKIAFQEAEEEALA